MTGASPVGVESVRWSLMSDEYCDLCDLPKATCVHGQPPPPPKPVTAPAPRARAVTRGKVPGTPPKAVSAGGPRRTP